MAKLRAVKERKERTEDFAQDLRGLGDSEILANEYPWVFLAVSSARNLEHGISLIGAKEKKSSLHNCTYIYLTDNKITHKEKTVLLMGLAFFLSSKSKDVKMYLGEVQILRERFEGSPLSNVEDRHMKSCKVDLQPGLTVQANCQIYLNHAGYSISTSSKSLHIANDKIGECMGLLKDSSKGKSKRTA